MPNLDFEYIHQHIRSNNIDHSGHKQINAREHDLSQLEELLNNSFAKIKQIAKSSNNMSVKSNKIQEIVQYINHNYGLSHKDKEIMQVILDKLADEESLEMTLKNYKKLIELMLD